MKRMASRMAQPTALVATAALLLSCGHGDHDLRWASTCGDPVGPSTHRPSPYRPCTTEVVGEACVERGDTCDPVNDWNSYVTCQDDDWSPEPCPVSLRETKRDIRPLDAAALAAAHRQASSLPLSTWSYRADPPGARRRLGFVIEDVGASPAVTLDGQHVDLYGYTSLALAALQDQDRQIAELQAQVAELRAEIDRLRAGR